MTGVSTYTDEVASLICERIANGESLRAICGSQGIPSKTTVLRWLDLPECQSFRDQYARAREAQADHLAEEILQIADDGINDTNVDEEGHVVVDHDVIARSRLRVDARKWLASKMAPKKYGDKVQQEITGAGGGPVGFVLEVAGVEPKKG